MKKLNTKGFTLAELLIVVAIIAVLVAISIPVFTSQLEKSREATDAANIRAAYAEITVKAIENNSTGSTYSIALKQTQPKWQNSELKANLKALFSTQASASTQLDIANQSKTAKITWTAPTSTQEGYAKIAIS